MVRWEWATKEHNGPRAVSLWSTITEQQVLDFQQRYGFDVWTIADAELFHERLQAAQGSAPDLQALCRMQHAALSLVFSDRAMLQGISDPDYLEPDYSAPSSASEYEEYDEDQDDSMSDAFPEPSADATAVAVDTLSLHQVAGGAAGSSDPPAAKVPPEAPGPPASQRRKRPRGRRAGKQVRQRRARAQKQHTTSHFESVLGCVERIVRGVASDAFTRLLSLPVPAPPQPRRPSAATPAPAAAPKPAPAAAPVPSVHVGSKRPASRPASESGGGPQQKAPPQAATAVIPMVA